MEATHGGELFKYLDLEPSGRGFHSFPFPLNLSLLCPYALNLSSLHPPENPD